MSGNDTSLERLIHIFPKMYHSCLRMAFEQRELGGIGNPFILFILHNFEKQGNQVSQKEIAKLLGIAAPTAAISIKRMEKAGLISKEADQEDLRKNCISLTEKGRLLIEDCMEAERRLCANILDGFAPDELANLRQYCQRMIKNMRKLGARQPTFPEDR